MIFYQQQTKCVEKTNISGTDQDKCEQKRHGDILAYIPVRSVDTKTDYRNVYCAHCNGEFGKLDAYGFTADCRTVMEADTAASFADLNNIFRNVNCKIKIDMP